MQNHLQVQSIVHEDGETHTDQRKKAYLDLKDTTPARQLFPAEESDDSEILIKGETKVLQILAIRC